MSEYSAVGGRQLRAKFAFAGATAEIERTLPLAAGEHVLLHGVMRLHGRGLPRPALLRLTAPRLVVLTHYAFQPDRVWELPRASVASAEQIGAVAHITWTHENGGQKVLRLTRWTGRAAPDKPIDDVNEVVGVVGAWLGPQRPDSAF